MLFLERSSLFQSTFRHQTQKTTLVTVEPAEAHLPLLSIIRTGNKACGRVSKQFFPQWKQGAAIFWAVWVTRSCSSVCLCVSCCFHPEACAVCQRPTQVHVPLCGVVPLWFSEPNHIFMVYSRTILLSLWQKPPKKYGVITPKLKEVDNADNSFRFNITLPSFLPLKHTQMLNTDTHL